MELSTANYRALSWDHFSRNKLREKSVWLPKQMLNTHINHSVSQPTRSWMRRARESCCADTRSGSRRRVSSGRFLKCWSFRKNLTLQMSLWWKTHETDVLFLVYWHFVVVVLDIKKTEDQLWKTWKGKILVSTYIPSPLYFAAKGRLWRVTVGQSLARNEK